MKFTFAARTFRSWTFRARTWFGLDQRKVCFTSETTKIGYFSDGIRIPSVSETSRVALFSDESVTDCC